LILRRDIQDETDVIKILVEAGAPVTPAEERTPSQLMGTIVVIEINGDRVALAKTLMDLGADPTLKDPGGKTAIEWAEQTYQLDLLAVLDPDRKSPLWKKYGAQAPDGMAGTWSNGLDEFKTLTLMLWKDGTATLFHAVGGATCLWRTDETNHVLLDIVEGFQLHERKITASLKLTHSDNPPETLTMEFKGSREILKRVATSKETEDALMQARERE
jgi:hypothetical protein